MTVVSSRYSRRFLFWAALWLAWLAGRFQVYANPAAGTVTQGQASIGTGSTLNINQTSANAVINWQSFNISAGETVNFNQPSSSSVTWNFVTGPGASSIDGTINANGLIVLQNPNGFTVGGAAAINAHGLVMTTASTPAVNFSSSGPWSFSAPPPTAQIVNYGKINITGGGSAFLIASDIENNGTICAPGGKIGLYAGENVLVSSSPDGRGLSAQVTLPEGSVDNEGNLIANAGSIAAQAQVVNQNGLVQANSVQNINGTIELVASSSLNLGANSQITANGDSTSSSASPGGFVVLSSGNTFSDKSGSTISASGASGGQDGVVEIFGNGVSSSTINSTINDNFAVLFNPYDMTLSGNGTSTSETPFSDPNFNVNDLNAYSHIDLWALDNIEVSTFWVLPSPSATASLNLNAGNNIIVDDQCGIGTSYGSYDWDLNLTAGTQLPYGSTPTSGNDGIYLNGDGDIYTFSGDINLWAANEVIVNGGDIGGVTTLGGGNINVTAVYGDVYTGDNVNGYDFGLSSAPYYAVDPYLGGVSTYAGGNVDISAGGDVISYLPSENPVSEGESPSQIVSGWANAAEDAGSGAFGAEPGNVTITAGGNVYGHYVVANGVGTITAGGNIGVPLSSSDQNDGFALSLISGSWSVYAPNGNIYVQDINNPNGLFGEVGTTTSSSPQNDPGYHVYNYSASSSVLLDAGEDVEITGEDAPQAPPSVAAQGNSMPMILPPSLTVDCGGDFTLDTSVILFPSPDQNLNLNIGGNFIGALNGTSINLEMSDSGASQWTSPTSFGTTDHATTPPELNNPNPVEINVGENMENVNLFVDNEAEVNVGGNMENSSFVGQNMQASDNTKITVTGEIEYSPLYAFVSLAAGLTSAESSQPSVWDSFFDYAVSASAAAIDSINVYSIPGCVVNGKVNYTVLADYLKNNHDLLFPTDTGNTQLGANPGFVYDASSLQLGFKGAMSSSLLSMLETGTFTVLVTDSQGNPIVNSSGDLETKTYTLSSSAISALQQLYTASQSDVNPSSPYLGLQIGGPGQFTINAGSINLGDSEGIASLGFGYNKYESDSPNYASLESICGTVGSGGAAVNVNVSGDLDMISSAIYSIDGGDVTVNVNGDINLSQGSFIFPVDTCYGIWTSGYSDVNVTANGNINIGSSRIATFDGGNVVVTSQEGDVNCGNGANIALEVPAIYLVNGSPVVGAFGSVDNAQDLITDPAPYGSGILAEFPTTQYQTPGASQPGDITVNTPNGNIVSVLGGISQFALDATIGGGPTITLNAGTSGTPATTTQGNILLGGAIEGGTVNINATGKVEGEVISQGNANIVAPTFIGTVLSGGTASFSGNVSGIAVGIGGISVASGGDVSGATLLSQNVSADGVSGSSTLGNSATATASSQAAAQQGAQSTTQVATTVYAAPDDKNKKKAKIHVSRVTVILASAAGAK